MVWHLLLFYEGEDYCMLADLYLKNFKKKLGIIKPCREKPNKRNSKITHEARKARSTT